MHIVVLMKAVPLVGTVDNWDPVGESPYGIQRGIAGSDCLFKDHTLIRCIIDVAGLTVTGLATSGDENARDWGPLKVFLNLGPGTMTFANLNAGSVIQNRLQCPNGRDFILPPGSAVWFVHPYFFEPAGGTPQWWCLGASNEVFPSVSTPTRVTAKQITLTPADAPAMLPAVPAVTSDYAPGSAAIWEILTHPNGSIVDGFVPVQPLVPGEIHVVRNVGSGPLIIPHETASASAINNRFVMPGQAPAIIPQQGCEIIEYLSVGKWGMVDRGNVEMTFSTPGFIVPAVFPAANVNDYDPSDAVTGLSGRYAYQWRVQGAVGTNLTGISAAPVGAQAWMQNDRILLTNLAAGMTIKHASGLSAAGNRIHCPGGADVVLAQFGNVEVIRDQTNAVWYLLRAN